MRKINLFFLSLLIIAACCENDPPEVEECTDEACFNLSELISKTDHYLPFILYNDLETEFEKIVLNDTEISFEYGHPLPFEQTGFYELILFENVSEGLSDTILFNLVTAEREAAEWGIETWIPAAFTTGVLYADEIIAIYPRRFLPGMGVPFIFYVLKNDLPAEGYFPGRSIPTDKEFFIKHGEGSVMLPADELQSPQSFAIDEETVQCTLQEVEAYTLELGGTISEPYSVPENSVVRIREDLYLTGSASSFSVSAGSLIVIDEGVNIYTECPVNITGTADNPVLFTCTDSGKYWGGFLLTGELASATASYAIFCQSGYHNSGDYTTWGHAKRQALFYINGAEVNLDHCYMTDHIGQIFYPLNATLHLESILVQRAKTSGQLNSTTATISNSIFTDFPDDSRVYRDEDNDALYISFSNVTIDNCLFMFAKDDGIDSGGDQGGTVSVTDSRFEACFHEGAALSSKNDVVKTHLFVNCIFYNCGQGLEIGFSSTQHSVTAENCQFLNNGIGIRYGDNYSWSAVNGHMYINNSQSIGNGRDVWNMVHNIWAPMLDHMHFNNVQVSEYVSQYPNLEVIKN
jgi:hypothetical protein